MKKFYFLPILLGFWGSAYAQCEGLSVDLPDAHEPVVNPNITFCVSFAVNPAVTGHPIGANMYVFHTFQGDLSIRVHACGNTLMLMTRPGGGSCNAGGGFGSPQNMEGYYSFMDGGGLNPDNGVELCGGGYGLSGDPCGVNTVNSWAELTTQCGGAPYTLELCFADHAFAFAGFAEDIQLIFSGSDICGCMDPEASSYNPFATIPTQTCCYPPCDLAVSIIANNPETCELSNGSATVNATGGSGTYNFEWNTNPSQFNSTATGLSSGSYTVTVTDQQNPGCIGIATVFIGSNPGHELNHISLDPDCIGDNGSIQIITTGGSSNFSYVWAHNPNLSGNTASNLPPGSYQVTVIDLDTGCEVEHEVLLSPPVPIEVSAIVIQPDCDIPLGTIELQISGGTGEFIFDWAHDPTLNGPVAMELEPGLIYHVLVTDAQNQCTGFVDIEIEESLYIDVTAEIFETTCNESNGGFQISIEGGEGPYSTTWFGPIFGEGELGIDLPAGVYAILVVDLGSGCTGEIEIEIPDSDPLILDFFITHTSCGEENGYLSINPVNGSGIYEYIWTSGDPIVGPEGIDLSSGAYSILVNDLVSGCATEETVFIEESEALGVFALITPTDCGQTNGTITLNVENGSGNYLYFWSSGSDNTNTLTNLAGGVYGVTVVDAQSGCEYIETYILESSEPFDVNVTNTGTTCGENNGAIEITPLSGSGNFSYVWSHDNNLTGSIAEGLTGGLNYTITITDEDNDCSFVLSELVEESTELNVEIHIDPLRCFEDEAAITITPIGGSGDYTYDWEGHPSVDLPMLSGLAAGNYLVTVTDNNEGCTNVFEIEVTSIELLTSQCVVVNHESGSGEQDGRATIQTQGGTGRHLVRVTHVISGIVVFQSETDSPGMITLDNLVPGVYEVFITDENGCEQTCMFTIEPGACQLMLSLVEVLDPLCFDQETGSIEIITNGGVGTVNLTWYTDHELATDVTQLGDLSAGTYLISSIDELGCTDTIEVNLSNPEPILLTCMPVHESAPEEGDGAVRFGLLQVVYPVSIILSGPVNIQMDFSDSDEAGFEDLLPGEYSVRVVDQNGCEAQCTFRINSSDCVLDAVISKVENVLCFGQTNGLVQLDILDAEGEVNIIWNQPVGTLSGNTISGLGPGNVTIILTDELGCELMLNAAIGEPTELQINALIEDTDCVEETGRINITVIGGIEPYEIIWSDGNTLLERNDLAAGTYHFTITDVNGCEISDNLNIRMKDSPEIQITEIEHNTCFGGADGIIRIQTIPDWQQLTLEWSHGLINNPSATELSAGEYSLTATDSNGCGTFINITIEEQPPIVLEFQTEIPDCGEENGSIIVIASGGAGPYQMVSPVISDMLILEGLASGEYQIVIIDSEGCEMAGVVSLPERGIPEVDAGDNLFLTCRENSGTLGLHLDQSDQGIRYQWYFQHLDHPFGINQPVIKVDTPGIYILEVIQIFTGCSGLDTVIVEILGDPIAAVSFQWEDPSCDGFADGIIIIEDVEGGTAPFQVTVNDVIQPSFTIDGLTPGEYSIAIEDQYGCMWPELIVTLESPPVYTIDVPSIIVINFGASQDITAHTNIPDDQIAGIRWEDDQGVICDPCQSLTLEGYSPVTDNLLRVVITTLSGCVINAEIAIQIIKLRNIFVPSAFSPNLDNINDRFFIYGDDQLENISAMRIFDRWGNKMFEKLDIMPNQENEGWRGDFKGKFVDPGVYIYVFEVKFVDGEERVYYGDITVVR